MLSNLGSVPALGNRFQDVPPRASSNGLPGEFAPGYAMPLLAVLNFLISILKSSEVNAASADFFGRRGEYYY